MSCNSITCFLVSYMVDIKKFRIMNKITQPELAEYLGISQGFISQPRKRKINCNMLNISVFPSLPWLVSNN